MAPRRDGWISVALAPWTISAGSPSTPVASMPASSSRQINVSLVSVMP